jgi:serine/threonine protein kinase
MTQLGHAQSIRRTRGEVLLQRSISCQLPNLKPIRRDFDEIRAFQAVARYPSLVDTQAQEQPDKLIGQPLFGSYVIARRIGEGGMGVVYAVESQELGKTLAMKVLRGDSNKVSATTTARFIAEARAASAINHRNIIDVIDSAELPDGRRYILMEWLEGPTLRQFAKSFGPFSMEIALSILAQVCSGLQAAHDRGIIHRDLKPSNIIITPQPDNPYFVKILDFGIAKLSDPAMNAEVETQTSALAGTPAYMAPEQARALRDVDARTDIYAVGVMAYRLFCGQLPFCAHSIGELVHQQTTTAPEILSVRRGDLPGPWIELVHRSMSMDPAQRPQSAHELAGMMIAATPDGEAIAKRSASLLFTTEDGSFSGSQESGERAPDAWSHVSMPDGTILAAAPPTSAPQTSRYAIVGILMLLGIAGFLTFLVLRGQATSEETAVDPGETAGESQTEAAKEAPVQQPVITPIVVPLHDAAPAAAARTTMDAAAEAVAKSEEDRKVPKRKGGPKKDPTKKGDKGDKDPKDPKGNEEDLFNLRK